jgi:hypothetical protein
MFQAHSQVLDDSRKTHRYKHLILLFYTLSHKGKLYLTLRAAVNGIFFVVSSTLQISKLECLLLLKLLDFLYISVRLLDLPANIKLGTKHYIKQERLARDKHKGLSRPFVSYKENKVL